MSWTDEEIAAVNLVLNPSGRSRQRQVELRESPRGTLPNGALDFREFPLTTASSVIISNADFTESRSPKNDFGVEESIQFSWLTCDGVIFDRARPFHRISGQFTNCSFQRIGTDRGGIGGKFVDCDFTGASFRNVHLSANFIRCKFHDCNLKVASWGSSFEDCEFAGASIGRSFAHVAEVALSAERVTFVVVSGKVRPGETRHIS
jgi:uncharacterized protein YjbI with pentapeptide repeats